jgi:hypothetical protein
MAKLEPFRGDYYLWEYVPSIAASIVFLILFFIPTAYHCWKAWKIRARFCIPFCIGGICTTSPLSTNRTYPSPTPLKPPQLT